MSQFARGFRLHLAHGQVLDGALFPTGACVVLEDPEHLLVVGAPSLEDLGRGYGAARIEWPDAEEGAP